MIIALPVIAIELKRRLESKKFYWPQTVLSDCTPQGWQSSGDIKDALFPHCSSNLQCTGDPWSRRRGSQGEVAHSTLGHWPLRSLQAEWVGCRIFVWYRGYMRSRLLTPSKKKPKRTGLEIVLLLVNTFSKYFNNIILIAIADVTLPLLISLIYRWYQHLISLYITLDHR